MAAGASQTQDDDRLGPGVRVGSYLIERRLGSGGMGSVFAARHIGLDKPVALKTLHATLASREEQVLRFVREGRAASRIRHPHVVDVTDVGTHDGVPFLVMEYLEGEDLQSRLASCKLFTPTEIARIVLPVLDAVGAAHDKGVVHRDLKPSNVFLERGPHGVDIPKVLDFGIAKILDSDKLDQKTITRAAMFLGTPYYASPEQAQSGTNADAKSDQYSIGAMMYQLATGRVPVEGATPFEVLCAIVAGQVTPIRVARPDVLPELAAIIERAMAFHAADRYPSVRELGAALLPLAEPMVRAQWEPAFGRPTFGDSSIDGATGEGRASGAEGPAPGSSLRNPSFPRPPAMPADMAFAPTVDSATSVAPAMAAEPVERRRTGLVLGAALAGLAFAALAAGGALWWTQRRTAPPEDVPVAGGPSAEADPSAPIQEQPEAPADAVDPAAPADDRQSADVTPEAAPVEPPSEVEIVVEPDTATIEVDGEEVGVGAALLIRDGRAHTVRVSAAGHRAQELRVAPDDTPPSRIVLSPVEVDHPRPPPVTTPRPEVRTPRPLSPQPRPLGGRPSSRPSGWGRSRPAVGRNSAPIID